MNLFENFEDIINEDFIAKLKSYSSDNLGDVEVAVKGVFYTLVAGLIRRTNSDMSAGMLYNQIKEKYNKIAAHCRKDDKENDGLSDLSDTRIGITELSEIQVRPADKSVNLK